VRITTACAGPDEVPGSTSGISSTDDYRFVYIGRAGSRTCLHADVVRSFSWSINVAGAKRYALCALLCCCHRWTAIASMHSLLGWTGWTDWTSIARMQQPVSSRQYALLHTRCHLLCLLHQSRSTSSELFRTVDLNGCGAGGCCCLRA
jgi:hypothetical protein